MTPVFQIVSSKDRYNNCWSAVLASFFDLPLSKVRIDGGAKNFHKKTNLFLEPYGLTYIEMLATDDTFNQIPSDLLFVGVGRWHTNIDYHSVILKIQPKSRQLLCVHDPHPQGRSDLMHYMWYGFFVKQSKEHQ